MLTETTVNKTFFHSSEEKAEATLTEVAVANSLLVQ